MINSGSEVQVNFAHACLGPIIGISKNEGPLQFRNIPYSEPVERWQHSKVANRLPSPPGQAYDATIWGPMAPQSEGSISFDFDLIQAALTVDRVLYSDEQKCLNLVLTVPSKRIQKLPVMVFIHGGGFFVGCNAWPQYDLYNLCAFSEQTGKPVICVGIKYTWSYRLGLLGFLASDALGTESGNYGLNDQATALEWIQEHIGAFGGDKDDVTVFGQSAGSISTWLHLLRGKSTFRRAICMAGDVRLRRPQPLEVNQKTYDTLMTRLQLHHLKREEQIAALKQLPWQDFVTSDLNMRVFPTLNHGYVDLASDEQSELGQFESIFRQRRAVMAGDCSQDSSAFARSLRGPAWLDRFEKSFGEFFTAEQIAKIKQSYKFEDEKHHQEGVNLGLLQFVSDVRFYAPVERFARLAPSKAAISVYHLIEGNPFDGPFKNLSTHVFDIALVLQNYQKLLPPPIAKLAQKMSHEFLDFANGQVDTHPESKDTVQVWSVFGDKEPVSPEDYDQIYRGGNMHLIRNLGLDQCVKALELFQFGRRC